MLGFWFLSICFGCCRYPWDLVWLLCFGQTVHRKRGLGKGQMCFDTVEIPEFSFFFINVLDNEVIKLL